MPSIIRFGPAGNPDAFYAAGHKASIEMPEYLSRLGLNAYEYQCNRGVRISQRLAEQIGEEAEKFDIALSMHAPYYINLASNDPNILAVPKSTCLNPFKHPFGWGPKRLFSIPGEWLK